MQAAARAVLDGGVAKLSEDEISARLLEFDGYVAQLDRVREKFHVDLARVESEIQTYRERTLNKRGPGS